MLPSDLIPSPGGLVDGRWTGADSGASFPVHNPVQGELLAEAPAMTGRDAERAIAAAAAALQQPSSLADRQGWLRRIGESLRARREELGRIITLEHGKPLAEGVAEVEYAAGFFLHYADRLEALGTHALPEPLRGCRWEVRHRPAGVVGLITPWNFPLAMLAKKASAALAAGCAAVVKPASLTPLSALALGSLYLAAGVPRGLLNLLPGPAGPIADALCSHPLVRLLSFTGSTEVGVLLARNAAPHGKRLTLELGGNAPFLVFPDADLDAAAAALVANKFRAGGQTCVCTNRVYVQRDVREPFVERVATRVAALRVGDGMVEGTDIGPLVNRAAMAKVAAHVRDARHRGAVRLVGGDPPLPDADWGCFYPPTLLVGVRPEMLVCREETFGPVLAVADFATEQEALAAANDTQYGLAAYVFTADEHRAERCVRELAFGHVGVNTGTGPTPEAPFGGLKSSGYGREGGLEGLLEYCETQTVVRG